MGSLSLVKSNDEEADIFSKGRKIVNWEITDYKLHSQAQCLGAKAQNSKSTCILFLKWDATRVLHREEGKVSKEAMLGILSEHPGMKWLIWNWRTNQSGCQRFGWWMNWEEKESPGGKRHSKRIIDFQSWKGLQSSKGWGNWENAKKQSTLPRGTQLERTVS